jgi:hypothetical protein
MLAIGPKVSWVESWQRAMDFLGGTKIHSMASFIG